MVPIMLDSVSELVLLLGFLGGEQWVILVLNKPTPLNWLVDSDLLWSIPRKELRYMPELDKTKISGIDNWS
jgi:hypothetical protein